MDEESKELKGSELPSFFLSPHCCNPIRMVMRTCALLMIFILPACSPVKETHAFSAAELYTELSEKYEVSLKNKKYKKAYSFALGQLQLDPADTIAYLRLAIAAQHLRVNREKLRYKYSPEISEQDIIHIQIKKIANSLLQ